MKDYEIKYEEDEEITEDIPVGGKGLAEKYSDDLKNLVKALLVRDPK